MNCRAVRLIFEVPGLSVWEFAVMCAIARTVDNKDFIGHPSIETIAQYAHISLRQVQRTLPLLVGRGLISRTAQGHGKGCKNVFQVELDTLRSLIKKDAQQSPISQPVEDRDNPSMGDRQTLTTGGINGTLPPKKGARESSLKGKSPAGIAKAAAKVVANRISLAVNPEASQNLNELAQRIAIAHPRCQLNHLGPAEVLARDQQAIIEAILLEAAKGDMSQVEAGEMLLRMVEELAAKVPRGEWHFLKPVSAYFAEFEYRRAPQTFIHNAGARGGSNNGKQPRTGGNDAAMREFLESHEHVPATGDGRGSAPTGGLGSRVRQGSGVPILPVPGGPAGVQWPRRLR